MIFLLFRWRGFVIRAICSVAIRAICPVDIHAMIICIILIFKLVSNSKTNQI